MVNPVTDSRGRSRPYLFFLVVLISAYFISALRVTFVHGGECAVVKDFCWLIKNLGDANLLNLFIVVSPLSALLCFRNCYSTKYLLSNSCLQPGRQANSWNLPLPAGVSH